MSENKEITDVTPRKRSGRRPLIARVAIAFAWTIGGIILLAAAAACAVTLYLTPERLTALINKEASENLDADVTVENAHFTLWSSFPRLRVGVDTITVISRSLAELPADIKDKLPENADFLASTGKLSTDINVFSLLKGDISIGDISVDNLSLNLVAVSDSIANFNIIDRHKMPEKMPDISLGTLKLTNPRQLSFYDVPRQANADVDLKRLSVVKSETADNSYALDLAGIANVATRDSILIRQLPFSASGATDVILDPMSVRLSGYDIAIGNIKGKLDLSAIMDKTARLDRFDLNLGNFNVDSLLRYFPGVTLPLPPSMHADVVVNAAARLTAPYTFSSKELPSFEADVNIPQGAIDYRENNGTIYSLTHSNITGKLTLDGKTPDSSTLEIPAFNVDGEGTDMMLQASISDLFGDPQIKASMRGITNAAVTGRIIPVLRPYALKGKIDSDAIVELRLSDIKEDKLKNILLNGDVTLHNYRMKVPQAGMSAKGNSLAMSFGEDAGKMSVSMKADSMAVTVSEKKLKANIQGFTAKANISGNPAKGVSQKINMKINGKSASAISGKNRISMQDISADLSASAMKKAVAVKKYKKPERWVSDSRSLAYIGHTPEYLTVNLPEKVTDLIGKWKSHLSVKVGSGEFLTPALPLHNGFGMLELEASFDSVRLKRVDLNSQDTRLLVKGEISNLRQFLTSQSVAPLRMALDVAIDTVQINQLAGAYNHGIALTHGPKASVLTVIPDTLTPSDTLAILIPRNIIADIKASAMMTRYTNLYLRDLSTGVSIRDGILSVKDLGITSDFGALRLNFTFDTSDIQRVGMNMQMGLADVNVVNFFRNFHTLLLMMPQMRNIKGELSAMAEAKLLVFPNMYLNMPSIWADLYVHGKNLSLHQDKFIRRITRMMLIRNSNDIKLADMDIHASVHDNLMELYPFDISFDKYRLQFGGLNNFDGNMYYHLGINKSPVPFPFGINIKGEFSHPEIRFGGATYKVNQGENISSSVMEEKRVNLPLSLKCLVREMIEKAAEADTTPASFYVY